MKGTNLGEFEELVLLCVLILESEAYILRIQEELKKQANRTVVMGALHATLARLEAKEFLTSELTGGTQQRGGRRKRVYDLTAAGKSVLAEVRQMRENLWGQVPGFSLKMIHE